MDFGSEFEIEDTSEYIEEESSENTIFKDLALCKPEEDSIFDCFTELSKLISDKKTPKKEIVQKYIDRISQYLGEPALDNFDIMIITKILSQQINGNCRGVGYSFLAKRLNVTVMDLLRHKSHFDKLRRLNFLEVSTTRNRSNTATYLVPNYIYNAIVSDRPINKNEAKQYTSFSGFISDFFTLIDYKNPSSAAETINSLEETWENCESIKKVKEKIPDERLRGILYSLFAYTQKGMEGDDLLNLMSNIDDFFSDPVEKRKIEEDFLENRTILQKLNFVELKLDQFADMTSLKATKDAILFCYDNEAEKILKNKTAKEMVYAKAIAEKKLFYSDKMNDVIDTLYKIMEENNFRNMQERLEKKGMKKGISVLLYGEPGTGKTETVFQMARKTGRNVFYVDISDAKSCWFGESQKKVKLIFTKYKSECRAAERAKEPIPILLLNEADALISKRKDVNLNGITQEENAIQNILLEEIENLEGILIATTNIPENLDGAFERRFLFKLKFEKPELESRIAIWRNRTVSLNESEIENIARDFEFSGGEIDNIIRKMEINEILTGKAPCFPEVHEMCEKEKMYCAEKKHVGFCI